MAIITYLQSLGVTHLFDLNNSGTSTDDDVGSSPTPTSFTLGNYSSFSANPTCEGFTHSLLTVTDTSARAGAVATDTGDINTNFPSRKYTVIAWVSQNNIFNPTCIFKQGGSNNNFAFMGGALMSWQAADGGQPFLIVLSKSLTQSNRPYFVTGVWEHHTQHAGSANRVLFYINGVLQGISELTGTDDFPNHAGDIVLGNTSSSLKSFEETTFSPQTVAKNLNLWGSFNDQTLTAQNYRDIFERTVLPEVTIAADTVENQQIALDALIGNTYQDVNCAIRILQATDATNFRLFNDNINFNPDVNIEDISIQFVGSGTLTLENTNGGVIKCVSTPAEVERTSGVIAGGGSVIIVDNTIRYKTPSTITNSTATKLVIETAGNYEISGGTISTVENISGGSVIIALSNNATQPAIIGSSITFTFPLRNISITGIVPGSRLQVYDETTSTQIVNEVVSGTSYTATYAEGVGYSTNDILRIRVTKKDKKKFASTVVVGSTGWSAIISQDAHTIYVSHGKDGATVTGIAWDSGNMQFDFNETDNVIEGPDIGAWYQYFITTEIGIAEAFGAFDWSQVNRLSNVTSEVAVTFHNLKTASSLIIRNCWINRDDGVSIIANIPNNSIQIDPPAVFNQNDSDVSAIKAKTDLLNFSGTDVTATFSSDDIALIAGEVWDTILSDHGTQGTAGKKLNDGLKKSLFLAD